MAALTPAYEGLPDKEYRRRIRAWTLYDWANSAFATTILAAVLPAYYSSVAGATLPSAAVATAYWTTTLSISLIIVAFLSPVLGTIADVMRGKKKFLSIFVGMGVVGTGLLVLVTTGDWVLASVFFILGRVGFAGANVFYDALLPHVARPEDQDVVSTRGYAIGYLGGGLLLAVNVVMIFVLGPGIGARLSFVSVAIWWAIFSIPLFRRVPEPPAASAPHERGTSIITASLKRLGTTFQHLRKYRHLFRFLIAFLIYNDGIGTIISVAVIYGTELGFKTTELVLAILLVQFVGIPFSLIFGRIPGRKDANRAIYLAFIVFNIVALPLVGAIGARVLPADTTGAPPAPYETVGTALGEGSYGIDAITFDGSWTEIPVETVADATHGLTRVAETAAPILLLIGLIALAAAWVLGIRRRRNPTSSLWTVLTPLLTGIAALLIAALAELLILTASNPIPYSAAADSSSTATFTFNGRRVEIIHSTGPDLGVWVVSMDGRPLIEDGEPVTIDATTPTTRYGAQVTIDAGTPGTHELTLQASGDGRLAIGEIKVLAPLRTSNLGVILGLILVVEILGLALSALFGKTLFSKLADAMTTKRAIILAIGAYAIIAVWGFFLDAIFEFWFLAWMVAVVQGGSQALSRSMYASMSPAYESGEFFGFFSVMSKFSSILGPVIFAGAVALTGSSRPAVLSLVVFFIVGIAILKTVDVDEGHRIAVEADAAIERGTADA
ncbi:MAG: MFS transporter [Actinobacteria bacterium]|nr:MFS transporter [Actinomycetota bacterium]